MVLGKMVFFFFLSRLVCSEEMLVYDNQIFFEMKIMHTTQLILKKFMCNNFLKKTFCTNVRLQQKKCHVIFFYFKHVLAHTDMTGS